ncbi:copper chaperone PCu(A)C [Stutzerimonas sp. NM35]
MRRLERLATFLLLAVSTTALADLQVSEAKLRLPPGNLPAAGYFTLTNTGKQPVILAGAQSQAFAQVMMQGQRELALDDQVEASLLFADGQSLPATFTAVPPGAD